MTARQLAAYLAGSAPLLVDVREPWEFDICCIEGSINLPMGQTPTRLDEIEDAGEIVLICHHGVRSLQVAAYLGRFHGADLINLDGGVDAWAREVDCDMAVY